MPNYSFLTWQYAVVTSLYMGLAAVVASIAPIKPPGSEWKAFGIGFGLPVFLGTLATVARATVITPRGDGSLAGTVLDLMALF